MEGFKGDLIIDSQSQAAISISTTSCEMTSAMVKNATDGQSITLTDSNAGTEQASTIGTVSMAANAALKVDVKTDEVVIEKKTEVKASRENAKQLVSVDLNSLNTTEDRSLGAELVANNEWNRLKFDYILKKCSCDSKEISLMKAVIIGKLIEPSSDLAVLGWLKNRSSINELLTVDLSNIGKDLIYEISDKLLLHKEFIEKELRNQEELLFQITPKVFLYDLTNTYFEGVCFNNELAAHGKCESKRTDCPLVTLALVVDEHGFPVYSKIYAGNQSEPETLNDVLDKLLQEKTTLFHYITPTFVMDRGIATLENIALMKEKKLNYIVIERSAVEKQYKEEFEHAREGFEKINATAKSEYGDANDVYIKKIDHTEETCRVLCLSEGRERKETAIDEKKEERFLTDISKIKASVKKGYIKESGKVFERVGRLKHKYSSMAKYYDIEDMQIDSELYDGYIDKIIEHQQDNQDHIDGPYTWRNAMYIYDVMKSEGKVPTNELLNNLVNDLVWTLIDTNRE